MCSRGARPYPEAVKGLWERIKTQERAEEDASGKANGGKDIGRHLDVEPEGALAGVPVTLPALTRALKAAGQGRQRSALIGTIRWRCSQKSARKPTRSRPSLRGNRTAAAAEVGDLLFAVVNMARHLDADPEAALRRHQPEIRAAFAAIERALVERRQDPARGHPREMDDLWTRPRRASKAADQAPPSGSSTVRGTAGVANGRPVLAVIPGANIPRCGYCLCVLASVLAASSPRPLRPANGRRARSGS